MKSQAENHRAADRAGLPHPGTVAGDELTRKPRVKVTQASKAHVRGKRGWP